MRFDSFVARAMEGKKIGWQESAAMLGCPSGLLNKLTFAALVFIIWGWRNHRSKRN